MHKTARAVVKNVMQDCSLNELEFTWRTIRHIWTEWQTGLIDVLLIFRLEKQCFITVHPITFNNNSNI